MFHAKAQRFFTNWRDPLVRFASFAPLREKKDFSYF